MSGYNIGSDSLVKGVDAVVRAGTNPATAQVIGFVREYSIQKNIQTDTADVVGEFLPVSIDPVGISVSGSMSGFIPKKGLKASDYMNLPELNADDDAIVESKLTPKIPYIEIYDKKTKSIIGSTTWAVLTGYGVNSQGKGYMIASVNFTGIGFWNGSDYPSSKLFKV